MPQRDSGIALKNSALGQVRTEGHRCDDRDISALEESRNVRTSRTPFFSACRHSLDLESYREVVLAACSAQAEKEMFDIRLSTDALNEPDEAAALWGRIQIGGFIEDSSHTSAIGLQNSTSNNGWTPLNGWSMASRSLPS